MKSFSYTHKKNFLYHVDHLKKHVYQIFLIPKNASSSIKYSLNVGNSTSKHVPHGLLEEKPPQGRSLIFQNDTNNWEKHSSYKDYMYYRIVFARNPYDRLYSSYRMFKTFKNNKEDANSVAYWDIISQIKQSAPIGRDSVTGKKVYKTKRPWRNIFPSVDLVKLLDGTFDDFVSCLVKPKTDHKFWFKVNDHLKPQHFFIPDNFRPYARPAPALPQNQTNKLGKIKNFAQDWSRIEFELGAKLFEKLNKVQPDSLAIAGAPKYNFDKTMTKATAEKIYSLYEDDFKIFKYDKHDYGKIKYV